MAEGREEGNCQPFTHNHTKTQNPLLKSENVFNGTEGVADTLTEPDRRDRRRTAAGHAALTQNASMELLEEEWVNLQLGQSPGEINTIQEKRLGVRITGCRSTREEMGRYARAGGGESKADDGIPPTIVIPSRTVTGARVRGYQPNCRQKHAKM